jgi:hypothetical protein
MSMTQNAKTNLAGLLVLAALLLSPAAFAEATDLQDLANNPQDYLGQEVEIAGYCLKGGVKGDVVGYECTTDGTVYVTADAIEPETAEKAIGENCDASGVTGRSADCRATLRFVPHSYTTSAVIEPDKSIIVINADKATVSF